MTQQHSFDVVIAGGGLSGLFCALALEHAGLCVALVDAQPLATTLSPAYDGRTTALSYACIRAFRRLGAWPADEAEPILDILVTDGRRRTRVSEGGRASSFLHFDSRELANGEPLGAIVENRALRAALARAAEARPRIAVFAPAVVAAAIPGPSSIEARLADGRALTARLLVAADGRASALRRAAGIGVHAWDYDQTGIVATVAHERDHKGVAQEFFLPSGPFAILPMTRGADGAFRSSLVWTERRDAAPAYLALPERQFTDEVARRFGDYLGRLSVAGPRWSHPLGLVFSRRFVAERTALIGDAARAIHPIAGQGFNLGVKDVAALADAVGDAASLGLDVGSGGVLEEYERWRRFDSAALAFGTDVLNRLFSNDVAPLRLARAAGMAAAGATAPARRFFMRQAGADLGRLPALLQPADGSGAYGGP